MFTCIILRNWLQCTYVQREMHMKVCDISIFYDFTIDTCSIYQYFHFKYTLLHGTMKLKFHISLFCTHTDSTYMYMHLHVHAHVCLCYTWIATKASAQTDAHLQITTPWSLYINLNPPTQQKHLYNKSTIFGTKMVSTTVYTEASTPTTKQASQPRLCVHVCGAQLENRSLHTTSIETGQVVTTSTVYQKVLIKWQADGN